MWSLVTETKKGVDNRTEALPMTIDPTVYTSVSVGRDSTVSAWPRTSTIDSGWPHRWKILRRLFGTSNNACELRLSEVPAVARRTVSTPVNAPTIPSTRCRTSSSRRPLNPASATMKSSASTAASATAFILARKRRNDPALCGSYATSALGAYNDSRNAGGVGGNARVTMFKHLDFGLQPSTGTV